MATIGEDLMTILGIMPVRDRAGIQRDTMAGEAAKSAAAAPSYSAGAPMQMPAAPPKFQVPQEMRGSGGDLQLPAEVPTEYASGKASPKTPMPTLPPGRERVLEAGPAAAPPPAVRKQASDVFLEAYEQRQRQQKMMQIIGHLGMMANAFNRNPDSQAATRESLGHMIEGGGRGGGGGDGLAVLKTALDMRKEEQQAAANEQTRATAKALLKKKYNLTDEEAETEIASGAYKDRLGQGAEFTRADRETKEQARARGIDELVKTRGLTPAQAAVEYDSGTYTDRFGQESEHKRAERQKEDELRTQLEPQIDDIAKAIGQDPHILRAQLKAAGGPQKIMDLTSPEKRASVRKLDADANQAELDTLRKAAKLAGWKRIIADPQTRAAAGITDDQAATFEHNPTALDEFIEARAKKQGELGGARGTAAAAQQREAFVKDYKKAAEASESYLTGTGRQLGTLLARDDLPVGTFSELRASGILRPLATALGVNHEGLNSMAAVKSALASAVVENGKRLPGPASDKDTGLFATITGSTGLSIGELRRVVDQTERAHRRTIEDTDRQHERNKKTSENMRAEFNEVPKIDIPEPSELLQRNIFDKGNAKLRTDLREFKAQMDASVGTPDEKKATKIYERARDHFDDQFGARASRWYLSQEQP